MTKKNKEIKKSAELIKQTNEDTDQVKTFIYILVGVAIVAVALYFISSRYVVKDGVKKTNEPTETTIIYNNVNVGNVFNRPYDEYYVFAFDPDSLQAPHYSAILNSFDASKTKMYFLDLSIDMNKEYVKDASNRDATKASELAFKGPTLLMIKDGKISKYIENVEEIAKELR